MHLLIKPASGLCNMRCTYCFYCDAMAHRAQPSYGIMSIDTLQGILRQALTTQDPDLTVAYQGGEPTLAGLDFFKASIELEKQFNTRRIPIHHALQTNGLLIDGDWAVFFKENHFLIGLSIDGPKDIHDLNRPDTFGAGTFSRALKAARLLDTYGVDFNILTVLSAPVAHHIEQVYAFFKKQGFRYLQFIPCLDGLGESPGSHPFSLTPALYGDALCRLFDLWYRDLVSGRYISIRQLDNYVQMAAGYPPESCGMSGQCVNQRVIEADGVVYPCDFYALDEYRLKDLNDPADEFIHGVIITDECRACPHYPLCRSGCRRTKDAQGSQYFCLAYKQFFSHAAPRLAELARTRPWEKQ